MAEVPLVPRAALADAGRLPTFPGGGVTLAERPLGRCFAVLARRGQAEALAETARGFGVTLPERPRRTAGRAHAVTWTGPTQWLVDTADDAEADGLLRLFASHAALGRTVALDDSRVVVSVGGARARDCLAKMLTIDLHPRSFAPGDAAVTVASGISVIVWLREDEPVFECAVPRSMAPTFWEWLTESAVEYGLAS